MIERNNLLLEAATPLVREEAAQMISSHCCSPASTSSSNNNDDDDNAAVVKEEGYQVLALYQLFPIPQDEIEFFRQKLLSICKSTYTVGSLLVTKEGINGTVCTPQRYASQLMNQLLLQDNNVRVRIQQQQQQQQFNLSYSSKPTFDRLRIRIKMEVVTMGLEKCCGTSLVSSSTSRGTYISPERWNNILLDDTILVVDTRNDYEVQIGTFQGAVNPKITSFTEFPGWLTKTAATTTTTNLLSNDDDSSSSSKQHRYKGVAMFCTGGIRCEKSTLFCKQELHTCFGDNVYHLEGGILRYLQQIPPEKSLWVGECFVFDNRIAVTHGIKETGSYMWCVQCKKRLSQARQTKCTVCFKMGEGQSTNGDAAVCNGDNNVVALGACSYEQVLRDANAHNNQKVDEVLYYVREHIVSRG